MKKILFASTALVASAGVAAAEVSLGGDGYFGFIYIDEVLDAPEFQDRDGNDQNYAFIFDLDFDLTGSGETDGGLVFGGSVDVDDADGAQGPLGTGDGELFVSGDFGTLSAGDLDSAAEVISGDLDGVGVSGLFDFNEFLYIFESGVNNAVGYEYNIAGATLALTISDDESYSVAAGYAGEFGGGTWNVGLGYEETPDGAEIEVIDSDIIDLTTTGTGGDIDQIIGNIGGSFGDFRVDLIYGQIDTDNAGKFDQYGISVGYGFDAFDVAAFYRRLEIPAGEYLIEGPESDGIVDFDAADLDTYGIGASYDLGGGLALVGGIGGYTDSEDTFEDNYYADFGLDFSF